LYCFFCLTGAAFAQNHGERMDLSRQQIIDNLNTLKKIIFNKPAFRKTPESY